MSETNVLIFSLLVGIIPALFWLWFWVREDRLRPEPKSALLSAFLGGIIAVFLALFFELIVYYLLADARPSLIQDMPEVLRQPLQSFAAQYDLLSAQSAFWDQVQDFISRHMSWLTTALDSRRVLLVTIIAPLIEEFLKLLFTYNICLRRKVNDEPIDASIYMLTTALGFAAIETALIIAKPLADGNILDTLATGNFRSVGPMLIHLISSATIGLFIGLAFYGTWLKKTVYLIIGFLTAFILHAIFNFLITLNEATHNPAYFWSACLGTWSLIAVLLVFFAQVKKVTRKN